MTTQELVELLHEAIESGMSVCYDDTFAAAASRLSEMEEEIKRLREAMRSALKRLEKGAPGWGVAKDELRAALEPQQKEPRT